MAEKMNYMDAYISNGKIEKPWYPRRLSPFQVKRKIMRDAFLEGYNVKQIAGYFKMNVTSIYECISVKALKIKRLEKTVEQNCGVL